MNLSYKAVFPILVLLSSAADGQQALRAQIAPDPLQQNDANDFFARGKNLYDAAQNSVDFETRRDLYLRSAEIFSNYIDAFPRHPNAEPAWWYLGTSFYQAGLKDDAKRCYTNLLNQFGKGKYAGAAAYTLAADYYNLRQYALAAPLFERFANQSHQPSDKPKGNFFAANCYRILLRDREAMAAYKRVIEDPDAALYRDQARIEVGKIALKDGKLEEALEQFRYVADSSAIAKYRAEAALNTAISATKLGDTDLAAKYLNFILITPGMEAFRPDAQTALMENFFAKKDYRTVLDLFRKSSQKAEGEKEAIRLMIAARATMNLSRPAEASELFREVERLLKPSNDLAFQASYYRLNCFFQIEGKHVVDQVDAFLKIYRKSRPNDARIHTAMLMKAETLFAEKKSVEAAKTYTEIDPSLISESNRPGYYYQYAWCLSEASNFQGATRAFTEFITKYPNDKRAYPAIAQRAKAYSALNDAAKAIVDFDRLLNDKATPKDLVALSWLESARTRRKEGNIENMLVRYKGLLDNVNDPSDNLNAEANYWIGWGLVKTNQSKAAETHLNVARKLRAEAYGKHAGLLLALSHFSTQDPTKLTQEIDSAIEGKYIDDIPKPAIQWAGIQAYNTREYATAARFLEIISNPDEPLSTQKEVWRYLAKARIETGKFSDALVAITHLLEAEENPAWRADGLLDRARALFGLKRYNDARKYTDEAIALRPQGRTSAFLRIVSGDLHFTSQRLGEAAADYLYVINFHEDEDLKPLSIHKLVAVLDKQGNIEESLKYKQMLATKFPYWKAP